MRPPKVRRPAIYCPTLTDLKNVATGTTGPRTRSCSGVTSVQGGDNDTEQKDQACQLSN